MKNFLKKYAYILIIVIALLIAGANYLICPLIIRKNMHIVKVPVAVERINEATRITSDMIKEVEVVDGILPNNVVKDYKKLQGLYVVQGAFIAPDGYFYTDYLSTEEQTMGSIYSNLNEGEYAYNLTCNSRWTQNNNIKVGQYINLYISFNYAPLDEEYYDDPINENQTNNMPAMKSVFGQLAENVRVLAISSDGQNITLACDEKQIADIRLAEHFITQARTSTSLSGDIIPMVYWDSTQIEGYNTEYYDISQTTTWIMDNSELIIIPEEVVETDETEVDLVEAPNEVLEQQAQTEAEIANAE